MSATRKTASRSGDSSTPNDAPTDAPEQTRTLAARMSLECGALEDGDVRRLGIVAAAFAIGDAVGIKTIDPATSAAGQSGRATGSSRPGSGSPPESASSSRATRSSRRSGLQGGDRGRRRRALEAGAAKNVRSPLDPANAGQIAVDRHVALVEFQIGGDGTAAERIDPFLDWIARVHRIIRASTIGQFGDVSADKGIDTASPRTWRRPGLDRSRSRSRSSSWRSACGRRAASRRPPLTGGVRDLRAVAVPSQPRRSRRRPACSAP